MINKKLYFCMWIATFFLASCATMNKEQCLSANWQEIGKRDGLKGHSSSRILSHGEACQEFGVAPDSSLYNQGHAIGIRSYCTPRAGFDLGKRGRTYTSQLCPDDLEKSFVEKYHLGKKIYNIQSKIDRIQRDINEKKRLMETFRATDSRLFYKYSYDLKDLKRTKMALNQKLFYLYGQSGYPAPNTLMVY